LEVLPDDKQKAFSSDIWNKFENDGQIHELTSIVDPIIFMDTYAL